MDVNGAVLLGSSIACDAHADRRFRVVTHFHADHLKGLRKSFTTCERVIMTAATEEILGVLKGSSCRNKALTLPYHETLELGSEKITLYDAGHIIGSAQVLLEDEEGVRLAYTGDFRLPGADIIPADVLVIEATYGDPEQNRPSREEIKKNLANLARGKLEEENHVEIYGYHGKLQEALQILRANGIKEPAVMSDRIYHVSRISECHGMKLGTYFSTEDEEAQEIIGNGGGYLSLQHMCAKRTSNGPRIFLSGWQFSSPVLQRAPDEYVVALSSHSDFSGLMEYIRKSQPQVVVTDNFRVNNGALLAREITGRLGIPAYPMPF